LNVAYSVSNNMHDCKDVRVNIYNSMYELRIQEVVYGRVCTYKGFCVVVELIYSLKTCPTRASRRANQNMYPPDPINRVCSLTGK